MPDIEGREVFHIWGLTTLGLMISRRTHSCYPYFFPVSQLSLFSRECREWDSQWDFGWEEEEKGRRKEEGRE